MTEPQVLDFDRFLKRVPICGSQQVRRKRRKGERQRRQREVGQSTRRRVKLRSFWRFQGADPGLENVRPVEDGGAKGIRTLGSFTGTPHIECRQNTAPPGMLSLRILCRADH
jgi:hypothetical protein